MIGARIGARIGASVGAAVGTDPLAPAPAGIPGVTRDVASGIYYPATQAEWTTFIAATGLAISVPDAIWNFQDASGNPVDSGPSGFTLTAAGTGLSYQQAVAGLSRKAIKTTDGSTGTLVTTSASLPDVSVTSCATLADIAVTTPLAVRALYAQGTTMQSFRVNTTPRLVFLGPNSNTGTTDPTTGLRCTLAKIDITNSIDKGYDDQQLYAPVFSATATGKQIGFGGMGANSGPCAYAYACSWFAAKAEALTDANVRALMQARGFHPPW